MLVLKYSYLVPWRKRFLLIIYSLGFYYKKGLFVFLENFRVSFQFLLLLLLVSDGNPSFWKPLFAVYKLIRKCKSTTNSLATVFLLHRKPLAKICNKIYVKQTILSLYTEVCFIPHNLTAYLKMRGSGGSSYQSLLNSHSGQGKEILKGKVNYLSLLLTEL